MLVSNRSMALLKFCAHCIKVLFFFEIINVVESFLHHSTYLENQQFNNGKSFLKTNIFNALFGSASSSYPETVRLELEKKFKTLCNDEGLMSFEDFLCYDEISDLIKAGDLMTSEVEVIFNDLPKVQQGKIDSKGFIEANWKIDDLFEFEEISATLPGKQETEMDFIAAGDLKAEFDSLSKGTGLITFESLLQWPEIKDMLSNEDISPVELQEIWESVSKSAKDPSQLDFEGFDELMAKVDDLFYDEDEVEDNFKEVLQAQTKTDANSSPRTAMQTPVNDQTTPKSTAADDFPAQPTPDVSSQDIKRDLQDLLDPLLEDVGMSAPGKTKAQIINLVTKLVNSVDNLMNKPGLSQKTLLPALSGDWKLLYTSSTQVVYNQGVTGLARTLPGASFREVSLKLVADMDLIQEALYKEVLELGPDKTLEATVDGDWDLKYSKSVLTGELVWSLLIFPKDIRYSFVKMKADRWKALRPANTLDLTYLDDKLRIMQVQPIPETIFIFKKQ